MRSVKVEASIGRAHGWLVEDIAAGRSRQLRHSHPLAVVRTPAGDFVRRRIVAQGKNRRSLTIRRFLEFLAENQ